MTRRKSGGSCQPNGVPAALGGAPDVPFKMTVYDPDFIEITRILEVYSPEIVGIVQELAIRSNQRRRDLQPTIYRDSSVPIPNKVASHARAVCAILKA
jgi:hypothetical protein